MRLLGLYLICFLGLQIQAQSFVKYIGGPGNDVGQSVVNLQDGGYLVTGETDSYGFGQQDLIVIRYNSDHMMVWGQVYGTDGQEFGTSFSALELPSGDLLMTARRENSPGAPDRAIIWRTDDQGEILWSRRLVGSGTYVDVFGKAHLTDSGELFALGSCASTSTGNMDAYVVKISDDGEILNSLAIGGNSPDHALKFIELEDGLLIMHNGVSYGPGNRGGGLMKLDFDLSVQWYKKYGQSDDEGFFDNLLTENDQVINVGFTRSFGADRKGLIVVTDLSGNIQNSHTVNVGSGDDRIADILKLSEGGYLMTMTSESINEVIFLHFDEALELLSATTYGESTQSAIEKQHNQTTIQLSSGEVLSTGYVQGGSIAGNDIGLISLTMNGNDCPNEIIDIEN